MRTEARVVYVSRGRFGAERAHLSRAAALRAEAKAAVWHVLVGTEPTDREDGGEWSPDFIESMRVAYARALRLRLWLDRRSQR